MLNIRNRVKLLLIFILLTSSNHYACNSDINVTSNDIPNQLIQANSSWWETITSFLGLNKKAKVNNNSQNVPHTAPPPHIERVPNANNSSAQNLEQTQEALNNQVNEIRTSIVTNAPLNKDISTIDTRDNPSTSFINLDNNNLPKVSDNNPISNNNDIELPDLPEDIAEDRVPESKNEQDILALNNHHNPKANISQNRKDEQQILDGVSEDIVPNYDRKYTPIRRSTMPRDQEIIKLVQPLVPQPTNQDNNQIKSGFEQNDLNSFVSIDDQKETTTNAQISPLQSDSSDVEHQSIPIESTNIDAAPTQANLTTQELHIDTNQIANVRDSNDTGDSNNPIDHISTAEHANAIADDNMLNSTGHNNTDYSEDDANNDRNTTDNMKSEINPQIELGSWNSTTLPTSDEEKIATDSESRISNSEKINDTITQSGLHIEQEQKSPATTIQSLPPIDKPLEQNQEQEVNTTELLIQSNKKRNNVNIDTFVNEELIDLARNDNNDMVLGSLTQDAGLILMDDSEFSKMIEQKLEYSMESQKLQGINNIINYHRSKIRSSKKQKNNLQLQHQAYHSIKQNEINNLRTILDYHHIINLLDADGNSLLHTAAKYNNYTLSKLLIFKGSNVDVSNNDGFTPLAIAIMNNDKDLLHLLYTIKQMQQ